MSSSRPALVGGSLRGKLLAPMPRYRFVHACCEPGNLLSQVTGYSVGVEMVEITKEHDLN